MAATTRLTRVIPFSTRLTPQWRLFCTEASPSPSPSSTATPSPSPTPSTALAPTFKPPKRGTRKSSRSGSGLEVSPSPPSTATATPTPTPTAPPSTPTPSPTPFTVPAPTVKPPKRGTRKSSRSGPGLDVSRSRRPSRSDPHGVLTQDMWDCAELEQMDEFERKSEIFLQSKPSYEKMKKFFDEEYDKMQRNETKYPGELTKILTGRWKGWRLYKPTFGEIPSSLPEIPLSLTEAEGRKWKRIFRKNREKWYKKGLFDMVFEGNVFELGIGMEDRCLNLTEAAALGIHWGPIEF